MRADFFWPLTVTPAFLIVFGSASWVEVVEKDLVLGNGRDRHFCLQQLRGSGVAMMLWVSLIDVMKCSCIYRCFKKL